MEQNLQEIPRLLQWAIDHGVDRFKGHHLWVTWPELENQSLRRNTDSAKRWNETVDILRIMAKDRIRLENVSYLETQTPTEYTAEHLCPFLGQEAWIEADGSFQVCCCPDTKRIQFGEFGSVQEDSLLTLWNSEIYRKFIAEWGAHPICATCNMRRIPVEASHGN
jgi:sulfatase maturation enzyme AslB (radical SAM superfamily)